MDKTRLPSIKLRSERKKSLTTSKVSRVPKYEHYYDHCENKENLSPKNLVASVPSMKKVVQLSKTRDREVKLNEKNPYDISEGIRMFSSKMKPKQPKEQPFLTDNARTIVDVDPEFYGIIEGRPIRQFIDIKRYMREIRSITTFRTDAAFAKDRILAIEDRQTNELRQYKKLLKFYEKTKMNFVKCISQSYSQAKAAQTQAEQTALDLADMRDQLEESSFEYVRVRNSLSQIGANFDTLIYFAKTLNSLAPPWWRARYDHVNNLEAMTYIYVEQLQETTHEKSASLSTLDGYEIKLIKYRGTPHLYLKTPQQLVDMFESFAHQCSNYMKIDVQTSVLRAQLRSARVTMRKEFDSIVSDMEDYVEMYTDRIKFLEHSEIAYREAFYKLVLGQFHDLFASYENSKLFTCIQYVNSQIFNNLEDSKDSIMTLMGQIESHYFDIILSLECLDNETVKMATEISFAKDIQGMKDAFKAQRILKEFDILHKKLYTSFEPPKQRTRPEIKWGQFKKNKKGSKAEESERKSVVM